MIPNTLWTSATVYDFETVSTVLRATWQKAHGVTLRLASSIWEANRSVQANLSQSMLGVTIPSLQLIGSALLTACNLLIFMAAGPEQHVKQGLQCSEALDSSPPPCQLFYSISTRYTLIFRSYFVENVTRLTEVEALQSRTPHLLPSRGEKERIKLWHLLISH